MRKKKRYVFVCLVLCLAMMSSLAVTVGAATGSSGATSDSIKEKEAQIDQAQQDKKNLQKSLSDVKKMKEELEKAKSNLKDYVAKLDGNLAEIEKKISSLKQQITDKEQEITQTQQELEAAEAEEQSQYEAMKTRIKFIYEKGDSSLLEILFSSESFGDFLNKAEYVEKLYAYDQKKWEEYQANCQYIALCKEQLELEKEILDEQKKAVEEEQANLEDLIQEKNKQITSYETDITNKDQAIREYEQDIKAQDEMIKALEAAVAEEKKKLIANNGHVISYDGGVFKFPLATYTRVSDDYGNRIHPTLGVQQFHNGVDFASPKGTAIYAAYDGIVVAATYSSTMGNYVMIDHGDGLYTIYMHASALYVKKDDVVARGDTIAAVGSTGRSTGNHLHFSVRLNGSYVSPWNYLSQ